MSNRSVMLVPEVIQVPKVAEHGTHIFHRYVASFTPELVDIYLDKFGWRDCKVLDPFSGGGTTMVECCYKDMEGLGVDLSPFACFLSRVKTTKIPDCELLTDAFLDYLKENYAPVGLDKFMIETGAGIDNPSDYKDFKTQLYKLRGIAEYFSPEIMESLITIRQSIRSFCGYEKKQGLVWIKPTMDSFYEFLLCGFSNILRACSGISSGSYMPYLKGIDSLKRADPWTEFPRQIRAMSREMEVFNSTPGRTQITNGDARHLAHIPDNTINLVITSPPYGKAVAYEKVERFSFQFLEFPSERYGQKEIGRTQANVWRNYNMLQSETARNTIASFPTTAKGLTLKKMYIAYFRDLEQVWQALKRVCKVGAIIVWVVGNNTLWESNSTGSYGEKHGRQVKVSGSLNKIDNVAISKEIAYANSFVHLKTSKIEGLVNPAFGRIEDESAILLELEN